MSGMDHYKGKIVAIPETEGLDFNHAIQMLRATGTEILETDIDYDDEYLHSDEFIWLDGKMYKMEKVRMNSDGYCIATPIDNGYEFDLNYYNGGCGFEEALRYAIEKIQ